MSTLEEEIRHFRPLNNDFNGYDDSNWYTSLVLIDEYNNQYVKKVKLLTCRLCGSHTHKGLVGKSTLEHGSYIAPRDSIMKFNPIKPKSREPICLRCDKNLKIIKVKLEKQI